MRKREKEENPSFQFIPLVWRYTQEAEGIGLENREAVRSRAGVQIPLSPPDKSWID